MKIINLIALTMMIIMSTYSKAQEHDHNEKYQVEILTGSLENNGTLIRVAVEGMVCDFCAQAIEKVFMKRDEVTGITINLEKQNVIIALKEKSNLKNSLIKELFLDSGYNVTEIKRRKL